MFKESKAYDSDPETDLKEIKKKIIDIISIEGKTDIEEFNPFKPVTIANWKADSNHKTET